VQGEYLPILVRLAVMALSENPTSVSDVYRNAVRQLLKRNDSLMDQAVFLCAETYWRDGERILAFATANENRKATLKMLLDSGLIVPADGKPNADEPQPRGCLLWVNRVISDPFAECLLVP
jgi:hypothetical protein